MDDVATAYGDWRAPVEDAGVLLWPDPPDLLHDAHENQRLLTSADSTLLQNVALPEVRRRLRAFLGHRDDAAPLVAAGHQAELHHPGVWAKNALIDAAAAKLGGQAYHFAVDTDAPKHLLLRWPGGAEPLTDDPAAATGEWAALVDPPTPSHLQHLSERFQQAAQAWDFEPLVPRFLDSMRRLSLESLNLPGALTNALHELDWSLGLRHSAMLLSPVWMSEPYLVFAHHALARAEAFAANYNAALADYRRRNKIRSPGRPMPDLQCSPDRCETPFWLDSLAAGTRSRGSVMRSADGYRLQAPGSSDTFRLDPTADGWAAAGSLLQWLRRHHLRLAPRALTLTMCLRLLAADQFAHGIGGGQYDQVTDALIARHLRLRPPRFCVTTATLYFPAAAGRERLCVPCVRQEGHRLRHRALGEEKMQLVEAISAAPRRSRERAALFHDLHGRLAAAVAAHPELRNWEQRVQETAEREQEERAVFDRELFYAIQPAERLQQMIERYRAAFA
jgi:hypothetical protein